METEVLDNSTGQYSVNVAMPQGEDVNETNHESDRDAFMQNSSSCFTQKTWIKTERGEVGVRRLKVGDMVLTRDHGYQPIRWLGRRQSQPSDIETARELWPIIIKSYAFGPNSLHRQLVVSPTHRILLAGEHVQRQFGVEEILVAAQDLTGMPGVRRIRPGNLDYVYFMFDQHEIVLSNGLWTESHQPDKPMVSTLTPDQQESLYRAFPNFKQPKGISDYLAARHTLAKAAAEALLSAS
ncbi:MAG: Hint domain-containing protein [Paracoccaceae bacterium]